MNNRTTFSVKLLTVGLTAMLLVALLGAFAGGVMLAPYLSREAQAAPALPATNALPAEAKPAAQAGDILAAYENALSDLYTSAVPSVVSIRVTQKIEGEAGSVSPFEFGLPNEAPSPQDQAPQEFFNRGQGTGFVWDTEGHIVTNQHVVDGATDVEVVFADGTSAQAEVLGSFDIST